MNTKMVREHPEPEITGVIWITMSKPEWREWNGRVQKVSVTSPFAAMKNDIDTFVDEQCQETE